MDVIQRYKVQIAIGIAVVVSIGLIGLVFSSGSRPACSPSGSRAPQTEGHLNNLKRVASTDKNALLEASSYLVLLDEPNGFLELALNDFVRTKGDDKNDEISLNYDCAKLDIKLLKKAVSTAKDGQATTTYQFTEFSLATRKPGEEKLEPLCKADASSLQLTFKSNEHYSCRGTIALSCSKTEKDSRGNDYQKVLAEIIFDTLELELDGKSVADAKWSTDAKPNSCPTRLQ